LQGLRQDGDIRAKLAQSQERLHLSYIEHHRIDSLPADLAMEWELRFMLDQQIVELIEKIEKTARDSVSYHQKYAPSLDQ